MTKLTENERKTLNNACARLRETNLGTKIGNIEDFLDIDILKTDANTVSKAIDELFDKWANPLLNITVPPPGFFTLAGDAEGNLWCYCNDETNPPIFEHDETTGDLYLNIASEDGANSYQVHVGNYIAVKHLNDYYNKTEIDSKLGGKSNVGHNHDERYYTETEIDAKVNNINSQINSLIGFTATIVNSLPSTGEVGVMYLKLNTSASVDGNIYDEYIWVNNKFEKIGSTETTVDLSGYVTQTEMTTQLANKANTNHTHDIASLPDETDMLGHMENDFYTALDTKANKTTATTSANGLMSKEDKSKLDGIATEANKTVVDSSLSSSSTNPVQNKIVTDALNGKADSNHTHDYIPSTVSQTVFGSGDSKVTATRQGNVVTLRLYLAGEFTESWKQWCTITDSQYFPDTDGEFTDFGISSSHGTHMLLRINSDGRVRTGYGQNKTGYCYQTITFLKNN